MTVRLEEQCRAKISEAYKKAEAHYGMKLRRTPIVFSNSLKTTAGKAQWSHNGGEAVPALIKLSRPIMKLNPEEFIARTPGHEAAHLIAIEVFGHYEGRGHGRRWQEVMSVIGQEASATHDMEVAVERVEVECACQTHKVTMQTANKMKQGEYFRCRNCKQRLTFISGTATVKPKAKPKAMPKVKRVVTKRNKVSNAALVRTHIRNTYKSVEQAEQAQGELIEWASVLFKTRSAARSCVLANTVRAFG